MPALPPDAPFPHLTFPKPGLAWLIRNFTPAVPKQMPNPLTHETFLEFVTSCPFAVVHFWAPWNERDQLMSQLLASHVPEKLRRQIAFASFNIDLPAHLELTRQHKVHDVPLLAFYRNASLIGTTTGVRAPGIMRKYLRELVSLPPSVEEDQTWPEGCRTQLLKLLS